MENPFGCDGTSPASNADVGGNVENGTVNGIPLGEITQTQVGLPFPGNYDSLTTRTEISEPLHIPEAIDLGTTSAGETISCDLPRCFKETDLSKDATTPCEETLDLLSADGACGENLATIAAVGIPYTPLKVPSLAGDDLFQDILLNDEEKAVPGTSTSLHGQETVQEYPGTSIKHVDFLITPGTKSSTSIKTASSGQQSVDFDICRICHLGREQSGASLVSPCLCSGTVEYTHQLCLTRWLAECGAENCELCGYRFRFKNLTAFRPTKLKCIRVTHLDRLHLLLTFCTVLFLAGTAFYVFWVALSNHPAATRDRSSIASQILLPVYATLDSMAIFVVIYELRNTVWRLWCKWRVLNLGVVIEDRETRLRNNMADMDKLDKNRGPKRPTETNQLIQQDHVTNHLTERHPYHEEDYQLQNYEPSFNDIFEPPSVVVENIISVESDQNVPNNHV